MTLILPLRGCLHDSIQLDFADKGGYIHFGINEETPFNAFYDIFDNENDNKADIEWNRETTEGRIRNPGHFKRRSVPLLGCGSGGCGLLSSIIDFEIQLADLFS